MPLNRTDRKPFGIQQCSEHYLKPEYLNPNRFASYADQYKLAYKYGGFSFVNIGSSNPILSFLLETQNRFVVNVDIDYRTEPLICACIPFLPFSNNSFDTVLCFQVLEHLPFTFLTNALVELKRISREFIIISLPDRSLSKRNLLKSNFYSIMKHPREWKMYNKRSLDPEHFWEVGLDFVTQSVIEDVFSSLGFLVVNEFRNNINPYHHFYVLQK